MFSKRNTLTVLTKRRTIDYGRISTSLCR